MLWEASQIFTLFYAFPVEAYEVLAIARRQLYHQLPDVQTWVLLGNPLLAKLKALLESLLAGVKHHLMVLPSSFEALDCLYHRLGGSCFHSLHLLLGG